MGRAAQAYGRRPLLILGFAALPIRGLLFAYTDAPELLVAVQVFDGISAAVLGVMVPLVVADCTRGTGRFNMALGAVGTAMGLGAAASTTLSGYMADHFGSHAAFMGLSAVALVALVLIVAIMPETRGPRSAESGRDGGVQRNAAQLPFRNDGLDSGQHLSPATHGDACALREAGGVRGFVRRGCGGSLASPPSPDRGPHACEEPGSIATMDDLCAYANRPWAFVARYLRRRIVPHAAIMVAVLGAVACSVSTQYGLKGVVDALGKGPENNHLIWPALTVLICFIAADNMLWRVASLIASFTFVKVTGDVRRDLFQHLTGHSPSYFADRQPGTLASRITATSNAIFTAENMFVWNVMPPCAAAFGAILYVGSVSVPMALGLLVICGGVVVLMFRIAAAGKPLHHDFAEKAASVDGEMVDLVSNMPLVRAFSAYKREFARFDQTIGTEMKARSRSLLISSACGSCTP